MTTEKFEVEVKCDQDQVLGNGEWCATLALLLDEFGNCVLVAGEQHQSERFGQSFDEYHKRTQRWQVQLPQGVMVLADESKVRQLADQVRDLVARVHAGHDTEWDGSNMVGTLTEDAQKASDEVSDLFADMEYAESWTRTDAYAWDAWEWVYDVRSEGVTAETTDEELEEMAENDASAAKYDGVYLVGSTFDCRREYRDELREELEDA